MQTIALTRTQPPRQRAARLLRERPDAALGAALREHCLKLLVALAGFGKTSAPTQQLALNSRGQAAACLHEHS